MTRAWRAGAAAAGIAACARTPPTPVARPRAVPNAAAEQMAAAMAEYERHGLIVWDAPSPVVAQVAFVAGTTSDSTLALVALSYAYPPRDAITIDITRGDTIVRRINASAMTRSTQTPAGGLTESIVFGVTTALAPGSYTVAFGTRSWPLAVPRFAARGLASPIPVYEATPRAYRASPLRVIARPRATAIVGRDSAIALYLEAYGLEGPVRVTARVAQAEVWSDTVSLSRNAKRGRDLASGVVLVPVARLGLGEASVMISTGTDSAAVPVFVGFGSRVPAVSFDQLVAMLRYFAAPDQLDSLRAAAPARRPAVWAALLAGRGDLLIDYVDRVHEANERYRGEPVPGWETDRGGVYLRLGEPDQVYVEDRMAEIWAYTRYFSRLVFVADPATGAWRLTARCRAELPAILARARTHR